MSKRAVFGATSFLATFLGAGVLAGADCADCKFYFDDVKLLAGASGQKVTLRCDNSVIAIGFSFGINYDETKVLVTGVSDAGTAAAGADYYEGKVDTALGLVGYGCVLDTDAPFQKKLDPGMGHAISSLTVNVLATTDTTASFLFEPAQVYPAPARPVKNLLTDDEGFSVSPVLVNNSFMIETRTPRIESITGNSGLAGKVFQVVGDFFGEPGLQVQVCAAAAQASLRADGRTLDVTAPACATIGCVEVRVCTTRGCDSEPTGFCYQTPPPPSITSISPNQGREGTLFVVTGTNLDPRGLVTNVCGVVATHGAPTDGYTKVQVTAPACGTVGAVDVEVRNDFGSDLEAGGFTYVTDPIPVISGIDPDEGRKDTPFVITGQNFDRPGLVVRVCGMAASHGAARNGGTAIDVTAPDCPLGPADVEVCTNVGCTILPGGFTYLPDPVPTITSVEPAEGQAGTVVTIRGTNFDQPDLVVRICDVVASNTPPTEGGTVLQATAPTCGSVGPVEVEVCNTHGCASDPDGFSYLAPVPTINSIEPVEGNAGTVVTIRGTNFDQPDLVVRICGVVASNTPPADGGTVLQATAPACGSVGPVEVEVCNNYGCASDPDGFSYLPSLGPKFVRGDVNSSGSIDISDAIGLLSFLFAGGVAPKCKDSADTDDRGDMNITDPIRILGWLFQGAQPPLPPTPTTANYLSASCAEDPTADTLDCAEEATKCAG